MDTSFQPDYPFKIVPFFSDFGFKVTFGEDSPFARRAVEVLAGLPNPVTKLVMLRNEFAGLTIESKAGVFDVICRDEKYRVYILEMQSQTLHWLPQRLMFYNFHIFNSQVKKGERTYENLHPVICICILKNTFYPEPEQYAWRFLFQDKSGKVFSEASQVHLVELGKFPILQKDFREVETDTEKLLYAMKYAHQIDPTLPEEVPGFFTEPWLAEALNKLDLAKMTPLERALLDISIVKERMARAAREDELAEREQRGKREGKREGRNQSIKVIFLYQKGKSAAEIAKELGMAKKEVETIIADFKKLG